jgi:serine/threonine-protein kinase
MENKLWQRAEELFHAVLERPPEARRAFLDEACGKDAELRRQVELLISKDEHAGSFLEKPALADAGAPLVGRQFGPYRIISLLGAGGMGEVYRARDSKLGRDVAIKTMPPEFSRDPDRVARFQREARMLASLNHPNIAAIHGLEESGGTQFLVLELVEGETLSEHIVGAPGRAPEKIDEILKIALQIAEALEAAHEKGIIHRDLKPANIKITPEGKVKVLDFGLAKAFAGEQAEVNLSNSPTLSNTATQQGVILGTAAYMSPEQARGKPVDKRTDIWAFGCVLFEMLTGRAAFSGRDVSEILASVIRSEPDWSKLPANLHWRIREVLERCLEKEVRDRYSGISDTRVEIQKALDDPSGVSMPQAIAVTPERKLRMMLPWIAAAVVLAAIITGVAIWLFKPTEPRQVMRFYYDLPESPQFDDIYTAALAVSPDGKQLVYSTSKGLYMRSVDELNAKLISGTEGSTSNPFFSPDGKWIGYASDGKLKKIAVNGAEPIPICDAASLWGAWWNEDNTIVYGQWALDIMRISANGGIPESIVKLKSGNSIHPQILPGGKSILYTSYGSGAQPKIMAQSLKSGETKELFSGFEAHYLPTGHIIYMLPNNRNLFAVPFNSDRLEVKGGSIPVVEGVRKYAISSSGTLAYIPGTAGGAPSGRTLVWVNREGKEEPLSAAPNEYWWFRISPDGTRVALTIGASPRENIWIWDVVRETPTRLTLDEGTDNATPLWTPDGKRVVYTSSRENILLGDLYWRAADGSGEVEKLASSPGRGLLAYSWSRDGKALVLWELTANPIQGDIGMLLMEGGHARKPLLQEKYNETEPRLSPDGHWLAYTSDESDQSEVYVRPFPEVNKSKWQVSTSGGHSPLWSPDGRELFYRNGDETMAVRVETEPIFKPGKPTVLFRGAYFKALGSLTAWDISPDGKRFLIVKEAKPTAAEVPRKINIVVNWFEELKQRVPKK